MGFSFWSSEYTGENCHLGGWRTEMPAFPNVQSPWAQNTGLVVLVVRGVVGHTNLLLHFTGTAPFSNTEDVAWSSTLPGNQRRSISV